MSIQLSRVRGRQMCPSQSIDVAPSDPMFASIDVSADAQHAPAMSELELSNQFHAPMSFSEYRAIGVQDRC